MMKITMLVNNEAIDGLKATHGLSMLIETPRHCLLFDLGPDTTLLANAEKLGVDLTRVDTVILSHGHSDHGGALAAFLRLNDHATVYAQRSAFEPHFSRIWRLRFSVSLDPALQSHPQLRLLDGPFILDEELSLFTVPHPTECLSPANNCLCTASGQDDFRHEQHLLIRQEGEAPVLVIGCGHTGVVNALHACPAAPRACVGGFHLMNPMLRRQVPASLLRQIADALSAYPDTAFYTCHCTGRKACNFLSERVPRLLYFAGGETLTF